MASSTAVNASCSLLDRFSGLHVISTAAHRASNLPLQLIMVSTPYKVGVSQSRATRHLCNKDCISNDMNPACHVIYCLFSLLQ